MPGPATWRGVKDYTLRRGKRQIGWRTTFVFSRANSWTIPEKRLPAGAQAGSIGGGGELATGTGLRLADGAKGARKNAG